MGVLYDYFRAADTAAVERVMAATDSGPILERRDGLRPADGVATKNIDPVVILGQLVAFARNVPWTPQLVDTTLVWPAPTTPPADEWGTPDTDDGPWVCVLDDDTRDALADVTDDQLPTLSAEWGQIGELSYGQDLPPDAMLPLLTNLVTLARRAQAADEHLYCWSIV